MPLIFNDAESRNKEKNQQQGCKKIKNKQKQQPITERLNRMGNKNDNR